VFCPFYEVREFRMRRIGVSVAIVPQVEACCRCLRSYLFKCARLAEGTETTGRARMQGYTAILAFVTGALYGGDDGTDRTLEGGA
jgi:hypothetical protein